MNNKGVRYSQQQKDWLMNTFDDLLAQGASRREVAETVLDDAREHLGPHVSVSTLTTLYSRYKKKRDERRGQHAVDDGVQYIIRVPNVGAHGHSFQYARNDVEATKIIADATGRNGDVVPPELVVFERVNVEVEAKVSFVPTKPRSHIEVR